VPPASPAPLLYAVLSTHKLWFTFYSSGTVVGSYALPVYRDGLGKMERIALTPLAATADLTMIGGAVAAVAGYGYVEGRCGVPSGWTNTMDNPNNEFFQVNQQ
jgi:hypothetical protein